MIGHRLKLAGLGFGGADALVQEQAYELVPEERAALTAVAAKASALYSVSHYYISLVTGCQQA
jgi:hypothetical protein